MGLAEEEKKAVLMEMVVGSLAVQNYKKKVLLLVVKGEEAS